MWTNAPGLWHDNPRLHSEARAEYVCTYVRANQYIKWALLRRHGRVAIFQISRLTGRTYNHPDTRLQTSWYPKASSSVLFLMGHSVRTPSMGSLLRAKSDHLVVRSRRPTGTRPTEVGCCQCPHLSSTQPELICCFPAERKDSCKFADSPSPSRYVGPWEKALRRAERSRYRLQSTTLWDTIFVLLQSGITSSFPSRNRR